MTANVGRPARASKETAVPLSEVARTLIDTMNERTPKVGTEVLDAAVAREIQRANSVAGQPIPLARVRDLHPGAGGPPVTLRIYEHVLAPARRPLVVYVHGGGWVLGDLDSHDPICRRLARDTGAIVASVDFRRAPEHPFPGPAEDVFASLGWLYDNAEDLGVDRDRIAVAGDSSGGNLAGAATLMARDRGGPPVAFQALLYPVTDYRLDSQSYAEFSESGGFLTRAKMQWYWAQYLGDQQRSHPYASLIDAELHTLPPTLIIVAECDPLRDEGTAYARRLAAAGNDVTFLRCEGAFHGFFSLAETLDIAELASNQTCHWIKENFKKSAA